MIDFNCASFGSNPIVLEKAGGSIVLTSRYVVGSIVLTSRYVVEKWFIGKEMLVMMIGVVTFSFMTTSLQCTCTYHKESNRKIGKTHSYAFIWKMSWLGTGEE